MTGRTSLPPIPVRTAAGDRLTAALVDLAAQGERPPCGEYGVAGLWTSDDYHERRLAVAWCRPCPILQICHQAAEASGERWGVWGGIDRTARAKVSSEAGVGG